MGFFDAVVDAILKIGDFNSRTTRKGFWYFVLFHILMILFYLLVIIQTAIKHSVHGITDIQITSIFTDVAQLILSEPSLMVISLVFSILMLINIMCFISLSVRRMHDIGWSGWWVMPFPLLLLVVVVLIIYSNIVSIQLLHWLWILAIYTAPYKIFFLLLCLKPTATEESITDIEKIE
ncbi:MAG: DUF805 domain-containing protein [Candidatus Comchoanobacterales bacterium]